MLWRLWHRSRVDDYRRDGNAWAVVTGSTDGIGKCVADDLLARGFNVFVHGRTPSKVEAVTAALRAKHPSREIESIVADLSRMEDVSDIVQATKSKPVTLFINNAAATDREFHLFADMPQSEIDRSLTVNVLFLTSLVKQILPFLVVNAPAVLVNVGSQSAVVGTPYVSVYGGCKGYMLSWTRSLALEQRLMDTGVDVMYADIHNVNSANNHLQVSLLTPSSEVAAKALVDAIGCGYSVVTPYWMHEISTYFVHIFPQSILERLATMTIRRVMKAADDEKQTKQQMSRFKQD